MNTMLRNLVLGPVAAAAMAFAAPASAQSYAFGDFLSGTSVGDGGATWASMSIVNTSGLSYTFTLSLGSNFDDIFGSQAFVGGSIFNNQSSVVQGTPTLLDSSGVTTVSALSGGIANPGSFSFDFGDSFGGSNSDRLVAGETVSWSSTFSSALNLVNPYVALHVQGIGSYGEDSGWYTPTTPIPEPETYAMLLAGLALLGFANRRRRKLSVAA